MPFAKNAKATPVSLCALAAALASKEQDSIMFEKSLIALIFAFIGYLIGRRASASLAKQSSLYEARIVSYKEILDAFNAAEREISDAMLKSEEDGSVPEAAKARAWDSLNALSRAFSRNSFVLPADVVDAFGMLSISRDTWMVVLHDIRDLKARIQFQARKEALSE